MAVTLKEETILQQWSQMVANASGHAYDVLQDIQSNIKASEIPGDCEWSVEEVQQKEGLFSKTKRAFLIVKLKQFKDYRIYVAAREYGVHLDCCWFLTVEPGFFKKMVAGKLADGDWSAMSAPKNLLLEQDLRAWTSVVHSCVLASVESLYDRLGQPKEKISRQSQGVLSIA